jgi:hypothetical protein
VKRPKRPTATPEPPSVGYALRSAAAVVGVVMLVLVLLVAVVYTAVYVVLPPVLR